MSRQIAASFIALFAILLWSGVGCSTAPKSESDKASLAEKVDAELKTVKVQDPTFEPFVQQAYGYVVFPSVGKGGLIAGGSYGRGEVYEQGKMIGWADISQATVGLQAGGQTFAEIICFQTKDNLDQFKQGKLTLAANLSAVAMKSGAGASARYQNGIAVFTRPLGGLMFEAAVGGQSFSYQPK